jgi:hypothetical protein
MRLGSDAVISTASRPRICRHNCDACFIRRRVGSSSAQIEINRRDAGVPLASPWRQVVSGHLTGSREVFVLRLGGAVVRSSRCRPRRRSAQRRSSWPSDRIKDSLRGVGWTKARHAGLLDGGGRHHRHRGVQQDWARRAEATLASPNRLSCPCDSLGETGHRHSFARAIVKTQFTSHERAITIFCWICNGLVVDLQLLPTCVRAAGDGLAAACVPTGLPTRAAPRSHRPQRTVRPRLPRRAHPTRRGHTAGAALPTDRHHAPPFLD